MVKKVPFADPGIAGFKDFGDYGGVEVLSGDAPLTTTTETVGQNTDLPIYSVVGRDADGNLVLATFGGEGEKATGTLTITALPAENETVTIGDVTYRFRGAGGLVAANDVQIGADAATTATNLIAAINGAPLSATPEYHADTVAHPDVVASSGGAGIVEVQANVAGQAGEDIATTDTVATAASWGAATLQGGVGDAIKPVGILTAPVVTGAGVTMTVDVYRSGMFNPKALNWDASFNTSDKKKRAFEGSISPNLFIQENKHDLTFTA